MKIFTQLLPVEQTGSNCKSVAIAAIDKKYAEDLNEPSFPLHKSDQDIFSIRQLAKQHGSLQGELLDIHQMTGMLTDLGYENHIHSYQLYTEFLEQVQGVLQRGALLIAFFAVDRKTREPSNQYDGGNEHAAIIHGIEEDKQDILLHITHDGKNQTTPAKQFFESASVLPNQREPEYYYKTSHKKKYYLHPQQTDEALQNSYTKKSINPTADNGFKKKFIAIEKPELNDTFKIKRKNLIDNIEFKEPPQTISSAEMKAILQQQKDLTVPRSISWLKNEMEIMFKRYHSFLQTLKQEILQLFDQEVPDFSLIENKFHALTSLLQPYKALTQRGLFKRLRAAGYPIDEPGQCYGISQMAMRAFLLGDMHSFLQRLHRIQHTPLIDFKDHFARIKVKDREQYHNFHAFFDYVMLLQHPHAYTGEDNVFDNHINISQRSHPVYDLLENNENRPIKIGSLDIIDSDSELGEFFDKIKKYFNGVSFSLLLIANVHAINLNYIGECDQWLLIDANDMPGHRYIETNFLVKQIMKSLFYKRGYILIEIIFYSLKSNQSEVSKRFNQFKSGVERSDAEYFNRSTVAGSSLLRNSIYRHNWQEMCDFIFKGVVICDEDVKYLSAICKKYPQILHTILQISSDPERLIDHLYDQLVYKNFNLLLQLIELLMTDKNKIDAYLLTKFSSLSDDAIEKIHAHFDGFKCLTESLDLLINHIDQFSSQLRLHEYFVNCFMKNGHISLEIIQKLALLTHTDFQPTLELVHLMIINCELGILSFYKTRGFIFKSEHLNALGNNLCGFDIDDIPLSFEFLLFFWDIGIQPEPSIIARLIRNNQVDELVKLKNLGFKFEFNHLNIFHHHYNTISLSSAVLIFFWSMGIQPSDAMIYRLIDQNQLTEINLLKDLGFIFKSDFLNSALSDKTIKIFLFLITQNIKLEEETVKEYILLDYNFANIVEHYLFFDSEHLSYALWNNSRSFILPLLKKNIPLNDKALNYMKMHMLSFDLNDTYKNEWRDIFEYLINERPDDFKRLELHLEPKLRSILDFFPNPTAEANCFVDSVLESSCTGMYTPVLRSESSRTSLSAAGLERSLLSTPLSPNRGGLSFFSTKCHNFTTTFTPGQRFPLKSYASSRNAGMF